MEEKVLKSPLGGEIGWLRGDDPGRGVGDLRMTT